MIAALECPPCVNGSCLALRRPCRGAVHGRQLLFPTRRWVTDHCNCVFLARAGRFFPACMQAAACLLSRHGPRAGSNAHKPHGTRRSGTASDAEQMETRMGTARSR